MLRNQEWINCLRLGTNHPTLPMGHFWQDADTFSTSLPEFRPNSPETVFCAPKAEAFNR
jgi:hypothetical protein